MRLLDQLFAGTYYYLSHVWAGGKFKVSPALADWVPMVNTFSVLMAYMSLAMILEPRLLSFWVPVVIFLSVEALYWYLFRRGGRFAKVVTENLGHQGKAIKTAALAYGVPFALFCASGAYLIWEIEPTIINDMALVPALVLPAMFLGVIGAVLLIFKLVRVIRARTGRPSKGRKVGQRLVAGWVLLPPFIIAVMITSFIVGLLLLGILIVLAMIRIIRKYESVTLAT